MTVEDGNTPCSPIGRISVVKMDVSLKVIFRFNADPIKKPSDLVHRARKTNPKTHSDAQTPCIAKTVLSKEQRWSDDYM